MSPLRQWLAPALLGGLVAAVYPGPTGPAPGEGERTAATLARVHELVRSRYYREVDPATLHEAALRGTVEALDPRSDVVHGVARVKALDEETGGAFAGIGAYINVAEGELTILAPMQGSPAEAAGLRAGDRVLAIDGRPLEAAATTESAAGRIKGPPGTTVRLTVERQGLATPIELSIVRAVVPIPTVREAQMIDAQHGIAYVRVTQFHDRTAAGLREALERLLAAGLKALLLDLRHNPGGVLGEEDGGYGAVGAADLFIKDGVIVSTHPRSPAPPVVHRATGAATLPEFPLVVLVDGQSASASEVLAGALQDHGRAVILGTRTFGKGSVQGLFPVEFSPDRRQTRTVLKLTVASYHTPSGRDIQKAAGMGPGDPWGIQPDVEVPLEETAAAALLEAWRRADTLGEERASISDPQVEAALALLRDPATYRAALGAE